MAIETIDGLVSQGIDGSPRALGRMISMIENGSHQVRELLQALAPHSGRAHIVGVTGAPGVGKSTTVSALIGEMLANGQRIGVLAVDPSSPLTGGALLGDRIRMQQYATDPRVYIRSIASRGQLGGLSATTAQALRVFDLAGFDTVLVETVGVGQSEVEIVQTADTVLLVMAPGMGDGVQASKAGILEVGDIFVVNKCDNEGADSLVRDLNTMLGLAKFAQDSWRPLVLRTEAYVGKGIPELAAKLQSHRAFAMNDGSWEHRRIARAGTEVQGLVLQAVTQRIRSRYAADVASIGAQVACGELDPYSAADALLAVYDQRDKH